MITDEPPGLVWINNVNMATFGSLCSQFVWIVGSLALTIANYKLLVGATEQHRQAGIFLAGILVAAWTGKTVAGVVDAQNKRKTNPAYAEIIKAQAEGKVAGAAAANVLAEAKKDAEALRQGGIAATLQEAKIRATREYEAVVPPKSRPTGDARVDDESGS